jgi:hypothetical protein
LQLVEGSTPHGVDVYHRVGVIGVPWKDSYDLDWVLGGRQRIRLM